MPVVCRLPGIGVVAGHIDILSANRGRLYILDYKPQAAKENPGKVVTQLALYAGGLVQTVGLAWSDLRCACFDEEDYYAFDPTPSLLQDVAREGEGEGGDVIPRLRFEGRGGEWNVVPRSG